MLPREDVFIARKDIYELLKTLAKRLRSEKVQSSIFGVVQLLGAECHRGILADQEKAAVSIMANQAFGDQIAKFEHHKVKEKMTQQITDNGTVAALVTTCSAKSFKGHVDDAILPAIMTLVAASVRRSFTTALLRIADEAGSHSIELKVGPIKDVVRISTKLEEYREERGEEHWPHSKFLADILRASFICESTADLVAAYEGLAASPDFEMVRVKNKIGQCKGPYIIHVNVLFHPEECEDPILCEVQFFPNTIFALHDRQRTPLVTNTYGVVVQDALDRDSLVSTKRRGKTATGRPAHQVRYSAEAQQRRQLKLAKPMLSSLRASASVVVA